MLLRLPKNLHYPITITKIEKLVGEPVASNDALFLYSYTIRLRQEERYEVRKEEDIPWVEKKYVTHFSTTLEGTIKAWRVWQGDVLTAP
jgi:RNA polymerase II subunit A-like phosphatase